MAIPESLALVVLDSGIPRRLEATDYKTRRLELERALAQTGKIRSTDVALSDLQRLGDIETKRLRHVATENWRTHAFVRALEAGGFQEAGRLLSTTHTSLRDDYEISLQELDLLVALAVGCGAYGARLLGGGFGGSILALCAVHEAANIARSTATKYAVQTGREAKWFIASPSDGACVE